MSARASKGPAVLGLLLAVGVVVVVFRVSGGGSDDGLVSSGPAAREPGIALGLLVDVSGSMREQVRGADGKPTAKIEIARRAAAALVKKAEEFQARHPDRKLLLGIYEFGGDRTDPCRTVVGLGKPDSAKSRAALDRMNPDGGTPIGSAIAYAKSALDRAALASSHVLVLTDGANTVGPSPEEVLLSMNRLAAGDAPSVYFVAFDVADAVFYGVKKAGGLVLPAADEKQLNETIDVIVGDKILVERPTSK